MEESSQVLPTELAILQPRTLRIGWEKVCPGDRLVAIVDVVDDVLNHLRELGEASYEDAVCTAPLEVAVGSR
jgi:hypothetical protein